MIKKKFEEWLVSTDGKTKNTAYSYKNAINKLSKNYSSSKGKIVDFFYAPLDILKNAEKLYSLEGNESNFGSNSRGINRNAIVALVRYYETFPIISAREFYKKISEPDIEEAFRIVDILKIELTTFKKYAVKSKLNDKIYPPKDIIRIIARNYQFSLNEDTLNGGEANEPFKKWGYTIINKQEILNYDITLIEPLIRKYQKAIENSDWLRIDESYKFNFIKWIEEHIDFENDSNEEIKRKIEESQQNTYRPGSNIKGVNFIQTITRYQDDYLTIEDVEKLKKIIQNNTIVNAESLSLSFGSLPKTSAFLCLFAPERFMAYDGESIPAYEYLSKGLGIVAPKRNFKAFEFYQIFYQGIKTHLKNSNLDTTVFKELLNVDTLTELHWNFITQDFLLFITRKIMNTDIPAYYCVGFHFYGQNPTCRCLSR